MNLTSVDTHAPAMPAAPVSMTPQPVALVMPWWVAGAVLGSLAGVGAMIVALALLVVWLIPRPEARPALIAALPEPIAVKPVMPIETPRPQEGAKIEEDVPMPELPPEPIKLARRMPSAAEEASLVQPPAAIAKNPEPVVPVANVPEASPAPKAAIKWAVEAAAPSKRADTNLIVPIEVARIEQDNVLFTLRRLRFPDGEIKPLKLAVTPFVHDDVAGLLKTMGAGYRCTNIRNEDTWSLLTLRNFDVVFLTCADVQFQDFQAALPLRRYVEMGGTLYASDLRGDVLAAAFPEYRRRLPLLPGAAQSIDASVTDTGLQAYLGKKMIPLTFDAPNWRPAAFDASKTTVCLKGAYRNNKGEMQSAPLLVKFRAGKGTVIFTSFHHSNNDSAIVQKLLEYLVFSSVSARSEARVKELMLRSQFAAEDLRPVFVSMDRKAEGICRHDGGAMQIALGFENQGAKLKLTLRSPSGKIVEHEDQGLYLIEIPKAEAGVWQYTVTPIELPHANFPILIAVGKPKNN
jgi:hypothetical protein